MLGVPHLYQFILSGTEKKGYNTTWVEFLEEFRISGSSFQYNISKSLSDSNFTLMTSFYFKEKSLSLSSYLPQLPHFQYKENAKPKQ